MLMLPIERGPRGRAASVRGALACLIVACGLLIPAAAPAAARSAASPVIFVNFFANGQITVTAADGSSVGTTSGAPTVIPAGYYTFEFSGPGRLFFAALLPPLGPRHRHRHQRQRGTGRPSALGREPSPELDLHLLTPPSRASSTSSTSAEVVGRPPSPRPLRARAPRSPRRASSVRRCSPSSGRRAARSARAESSRCCAPASRSRRSRRGATRSRVVSHSARDGFVVERAEVEGGRGWPGAPSAGKRSVALSLTAGTWLFMVTPGKFFSSSVAVQAERRPRLGAGTRATAAARRLPRVPPDRGRPRSGLAPRREPAVAPARRVGRAREGGPRVPSPDTVPLSGLRRRRRP